MQSLHPLMTVLYAPNREDGSAEAASEERRLLAAARADAPAIMVGSRDTPLLAARKQNAR